MSLAQLYQGDVGTPPTSSPPAAKGKSVWWISCGQQAPGCVEYAAAGQAAAKALGWTFHLADGNLNIANGYSTAIHTAIAAHPDAIILSAISCNTVQPALEQAKAQGIATIGVENTDCSDSGGPQLLSVPLIYSTKYPSQKAFWTGWGAWSGNFLAADSGGNAKIIASPGAGQAQFTFLNEGFKAALAKCSGCSVIASVPWTTTDLAPNGPWVSALHSALLKNPTANYVWWPYDTNGITSGGNKAVIQSGIKAKVVGGIGVSAALQAILNGQQYAEGVAIDPGWPSWAAMDELNRAFNHKPEVPEGLGFVSVTKAHNMPSNISAGYVTTVPYAADYKKAWGVG